MGNWNYTVDFHAMTQVNPRNDTTRSLRRVGGPYVKSSAERRQEEEDKLEEQRRRAQEVAGLVAEMEEQEAKNKKEKKEKEKAEAVQKAENGLFCACCSRARDGEDSVADMPV